jgi:hypothetical protein
VFGLIVVHGVVVPCLVKRNQNGNNLWFRHKIRQVADTGRKDCNLGRWAKQLVVTCRR